MELIFSYCLDARLVIHRPFDKNKNSKFVNEKAEPDAMQQFYNSSNGPYVEQTL